MDIQPRGKLSEDSGPRPAFRPTGVHMLTGWDSMERIRGTRSRDRSDSGRTIRRCGQLSRLRMTCSMII
jgi:hypothetical protein